MMPKNPMMIAIQRVAFGWLSAELICVATPPVTPELLTSERLRWPERNPRMPTPKSRSGTKNRNRRKATALLTTVPAAPRSRSYSRSPRSTSGRSRCRSKSCSARVRHADALCLLRSTRPAEVADGLSRTKHVACRQRHTEVAGVGLAHRRWERLVACGHGHHGDTRPAHRTLALTVPRPGAYVI